MSILGRLIRRNIMGKPFRSFAIIIALAASAFAMLFCIAGREAPEHAMREQLLNIYGGAELIVFDLKAGDLQLNNADFPNGTKMFMQASAEVKAKSAKNEYPVSVSTIDSKGGKQIGLLESELDPGNDVIISEAFSTKSALKAGDSVEITFTKVDENQERIVKTVTLKVKQVSKDKYLRRKTNTLLVNMDNFKAITGRTGYKSAIVDLPDDVDVTDLSVELTKKYKDKEYAFNPLLTDEMLDEINNQTMVFYLIFAVILLMTLFLTYSMSRHIANERLSSIGTLRSIGGSISKTSTLLIIESAVYGLVGGIIGVALFVLAGDFAVRAMFGSTGDYDMPLWCYPLAVVLAIVIQIICQSGALIKAVRTPVRDIIFSSRDTAYVMSIKKIIIGAVILAAGVVTGLLADDTIMSIAAIALICVGSVMVMPIIIKAVSMLFVKLFATLGMPTAKFAANEGSHKKSSVASTQLTFIALAITTAVFIVSSAIADSYSTDHYHYDVQIALYKNRKECEFITKLPEVEQYQIYTQSFINGKVNGSKKHYITLIAYNDFKLYSVVSGIGKEPAADEAYVGRQYAQKYNIKIGDTVEIEDSDDYFINENGEKEIPKYKFRIAGFCDTVSAYFSSFVVNSRWYTKEMGDSIDSIFVKLSKTGSVQSLRTAVEERIPSADVYTVGEMIQQDEEDCRSIMTVIYSILVVGCVLALLGAVSNAVIGFEQSRRKYAVLHSVAAGKRKLSKLILLETLFSSLTAGVLAIPLGLLLTKMIETTFDSTGMMIIVQYDILMIVAFIIVLTAVLMLAAIKPIMSLRRMNTAAELKYE